MRAIEIEERRERVCANERERGAGGRERETVSCAGQLQKFKVPRSTERIDSDGPALVGRGDAHVTNRGSRGRNTVLSEEKVRSE